MTEARVHRINVRAEGGVPKLPVESARIHLTGVDGDKQRHLKFHGGPMRAVCLYSLERISELQAEGHPIRPGTTGENLTLTGLDWARVGLGDRFMIGNVGADLRVELEVTQFTIPCNQIAESFKDGDSTRIGQKDNPGWSRVYVKVLREGFIRVGDGVTWTPAV